MSEKIMQQIWFGLAVFSIAATAVLLPMLYGEKIDPVYAATITVCASGCDFTTIQAALSDAGTADGDTIQIRTGYNSSTEVGPTITAFDENLTIECEDNSIIIGTSTLNNPLGSAVFKIEFTTGTTLRNCTIHNGTFTPSVDGSNITISENIFTSGTEYHTVIEFGNQTQIVSNTGQVRIESGSQAISSTIEGNVFDVSVAGSAWANATSTVINNNIFYQATSNTAVIGQISNAHNVTITNNVFSYRDSFVAGDSGARPFYINNYSGDIIIQDNLIELAPRNSTSSARAISFNRAAGTASLDIQRNTFVVYDDGDRGIDIGAEGSPGTTTLTMSYNIFTTRYGASFNGEGVRFTGGPDDVYTGTVEYNGLFRIGDDGDEVTQIITFDSSSTLPVENSLTSDPYFKIGDVDSANDYELAPFSSYLDVNGALDVGYYGATRGTTFTIDDDGTIDYTSVHATTTDALEVSARDGDTWNLAAGIYEPIALASSTELSGSNLTIDGAGAATIVRAIGSAFPLEFTGISSSTVQDLTVNNASSSAASYFLTNAVYSVGGNDFDDSLPFGDGTPENTVFIARDTVCGLSVLTDFTAGDITQHVDDTEDWNLALVNLAGFGGLRITLWAPNQYYSSSAAIETACGFAGAIVEGYVASALAVSDGEYTLDTAAIAGQSITLDPDTPTDPEMTRTFRAGGIYLEDSANNIFNNITSTGNLYGITFAGASVDNTVSSSVFSGSTGFDVFSTITSGENLFRNVSFTRASSSFATGGELDVQYSARIRTVTTSSDPIAGTAITFADSLGAATVPGPVTDASGFSPYFLLSAQTISSTDTAVTAGGVNPYNAIASATSTFLSTSTGFVSFVDSPFQTFTLTMFDAPTPPSAPSNLTTSNIGTSTLTISWDDNSGDENGFIIDYNTTSTFPGTTTTVAANTTSTILTGLTENTQYFIRVAAFNGAGTSSYSNVATSSYTLLSVPTVTEDSITSSSIFFSVTASGTPSFVQFRNITAGTTSTFPTTTFGFTELNPNTTVEYIVRLLNADNVPSAWTSTSTAVTLAVPPEDLAATGGDESVTLTWTNNSSTAYLIENVTLGATTTAAGSPASWGSLNCGTTYTFRVAGLNQYAIASDFTSTVSATTNACTSGGGGGSRTGSKRTVTRETYDPDVVTITPPISTEPFVCALDPLQPYSHAQTRAVYYVTADCTKRPFVNPTTYFTYFTSWDAVVDTTETILASIADDTLGFMPLGPLYDPASGTLIKTPSDPDVYLLLNGKRYLIDDEAAAEFQFGVAWASWIEDVDVRLIENTPLSPTVLDETRRPDGVIVKYESDPKTYQLDDQELRWIPTEQIYNALGFRWDRIVTISDTETYPFGPDLSL